MKIAKAWFHLGGKCVNGELNASAKKAFANVREIIMNDRSIHQIASALERQLIMCRFVKIRNYLWSVRIAF